MSFKTMAAQIVEACGGEKNITQAWHCVTRLRFTFIDTQKVDLVKIKSIKGVMGAQYQRGQCQVIIGNDVNKVFEEIAPLVASAVQKGGDHKEPLTVANVFDAIITTIPTIFQPILPAIVGGGLLKGFITLMQTWNLIAPESSTLVILNLISDAPFYFLPFLLAGSAANRFKTNPAYAMTLAGALLYPTLINSAGEAPLHFLGLPIPLVNYSSSVIPIILGVWLLSFIEKKVNKIMPAMFKLIFTPVIILLITIPILLIGVAPLGNYAGVFIQQIFSWLVENTGPLGGLVAAGTMSIIVMTGMHFAFFPGCLQSLASFGYDAFFLPISLCSNLGQAGATVAVLLKTKNKDLKSLATSSSITAVFGVTEPAIYGVTMRLKKPFYGALAGAALGGAFLTMAKVKCFGFALPGIVSLPLYASVEYSSNFIFALIGVAVSFFGAFIITYILGFDDIAEEKTETEAESKKPGESVLKDMKITAAAPVSGQVVSIKEVPDTTFSEEIVGKGIAVRPSEGIVRAPFDGIVSVLPSSKHAVGLKSADGLEMLIHVGLETVSLNGKYFDALVASNQSVKKGDVLIKFDMDKIAAKGIDLITPVLITNYQDYLDIIPTSKQEVTGGADILLTAIK